MKTLRLMVGLLGLLAGFCSTSRCESTPTAPDVKGPSCSQTSCEVPPSVSKTPTTADINVKQTGNTEKDKDLDTVVLGSSDLSNAKE